jgi:hypothetical protein
LLLFYIWYINFIFYVFLQADSVQELKLWRSAFESQLREQRKKETDMKGETTYVGIKKLQSETNKKFIVEAGRIFGRYKKNYCLPLKKQRNVI